MLDQWRSACLTQLCLLTSVLAVCWSRNIFFPLGIQVFLGTVGLVYIVSTALCFIVNKSNAPELSRKSIHSLLFIVFCLLTFATGYVYKHKWLGIHIYFVPTMSMYPALKPGQFILLDTWIYKEYNPQPNDIVVFLHGSEDHWLVKRVAYWPGGKLQHSGKWFVLGDNQNHSRDSRSFGGIENAQLVGQVKLVLLAIDHHQNLLENSYLQPVD